MNIWYKIFDSIKGKINILLSFALMCLLSSCGECETVLEYQEKGIGESCFFCPLYETLTDVGASTADSSWSIVASAAQPIVCVVIAIYIAFYTLKMVASMGQQSFADYLSADKKGVLFLAVKAGIIVLLLGSDNFLATKIIGPLLEAAANIGIGLSSVSAENLPAVNINPASTSPWNGVFGLMNSIARAFNDNVYLIVAMGKALICNATEGFIFGWEFVMLIYGGILLLFGWMVCIGVCYFLVDVIINLICASVLLPIGIALAISEKTMNHSKNIWNLFVNSFCSCLFLGLVLSLALSIIDVNMGGASIGSSDGGGAGSSPGGNNGSGGAIDYLINNNNITELNTHLKESGSLILMIVSLTLLVKIVESIKQLSNKLSSSSGATYAGSKTLTPVTQKALDGGMRLAKDGASRVGHVAVRITHLDELSTAGKNGLQAARGFLTGSGPQGYRAFWRRRRP